MAKSLIFFIATFNQEFITISVNELLHNNIYESYGLYLSPLLHADSCSTLNKLLARFWSTKFRIK